jgi:hypothetical protein
VSAGTTTIAVTTADGSKRDTCAVTVSAETAGGGGGGGGVATTPSPVESSNDNLGGLSIDNGLYNIAFNSSTTDYAVTVDSGVDSITFMITTQDAGSSIIINDTLLASGAETAAFPVSVGTNTFAIKVTAANGNTKIYSVTITRPAPVTPVQQTTPVPTTATAANAITTATTTSTIVEPTDINGHWAAAVIKTLISKNVMAGYPDGEFKPNSPITRDEFVVAICKELGIVPDAQPDLNFTDAEAIPDWASGYVSAAVKAGIISGYSNGKFRPDRDITRAEIAVIVGKALKLTPTSSGISFRDHIPGWASGYIAVDQSKGILSGYKNHTFRASNNATRAESAAILCKMLQQ